MVPVATVTLPDLPRPEELSYSIRLELENGSTIDVDFDADPSDLTGIEWEAISKLDFTVLPGQITNEQAMACAVIFQKMLRQTDLPTWEDFGPFVARTLYLGDESGIEVV